MTTELLKKELRLKHQHFTAYIDGLTESEYLATPNNKWSAGQQMEHIFMSIDPVAKLIANKSVIKEKFGTLDRPSRSYEHLVNDYLAVLADGAKAGPRFTPEVTLFASKAPLISGITSAVTSIVSELDHYTEEEMDQWAIPHPVMGPFSLREMLMFTLYHVQHHEMKIRENFNAISSD